MKKIIYAILVLIIVGGVGVFVYLEYWPKPTSHFVDRAIEMQDASICLEIETEPSIAKYPMECFKGMANVTNDISICRTLESEIEINNCYTGFISIRTEFYNEILCNSFSTQKEKNYCFLVTAVTKNDPVFCENISNPEEISNCKGNIK